MGKECFLGLSPVLEGGKTVQDAALCPDLGELQGTWTRPGRTASTRARTESWRLVYHRRLRPSGAEREAEEDTDTDKVTVTATVTAGVDLP